MEASSKQFIIVKIGNEQFGVEIKYIDNIIVMQGITRVPKSQPYYLGVINLRGEIIPVMSLRRKLGLEPDEFTPVTRIIIVKPDALAAPAGIIVDEVREVVTLESSNMEMMSYDENDEKAGYSTGVGKLGSDIINLLNIPGVVFEKDTVS